MIVSSSNLDILFRGFSGAFNKGFTGAKSAYGDVAMVAPSATGSTTYGWLGQLPRLREWLGPRMVKSLTLHGYTVDNKLFESTIEVGRIAIEDDQYGVFGPLFEDMGRAAAENPDELIFSLLGSGFDTVCYDGQNFFDDAHPVGPPGTSLETTVSNMQAGEGAAWYLLDTSRAVRPLLYQERLTPVLTRLDKDDESTVFWDDTYTYGVRARAAAGFGLWQLAFGSMAELNPDNYAAARQAMMSLRGDEGRLLGIVPDTLVVPPILETQARELLKSALINASSNPWVDSAKLLMTTWLAA